MSEVSTDKITLYTSRWCGHSMMVERFLTQNQIPLHKIAIDGNQEAREELIEINNGFASVPTLLLPDGTKLTEPSIGELRRRLDLEAGPGLIDRVRRLLGQNSGS